ncbi:MAG: TonB-dependent receptor [Bacteroidales bacterium]|nr:TonB-dependent receptor [Bacteroidales bacterium]
MKNRIAASILLSLLTLFAANAQSLTVSGKITDSTGQPVPGAAVLIYGSKAGVISDLDGNYSVGLPQDGKTAKLVVSSLGYAEQTVDVGGRRVIDIVLSEDTEVLEEAVAVGYGAMRRSDLTGSVTSVKIDEKEAGRSSSLDKLIQGHAAGVQVLSNNASPDAGVSIRVRGLNSFNGSTEPLYVIDGIILNSATQNLSVLSKGADNEGSDEAVNGLMGLNPQDIASMEILKDASATAIYGALGANGVVLITTKTATKDRPTVNFSAGIDIGTRTKKYDVLSFDEYVDMMCAKGSDLSRFYNDPINRLEPKTYPVDWQDLSMRTAISQRYYASVRGKNKETSYSFSFGYSNKQGIVKNSDVQQYTLRVNVEKRLANNFNIGTKTNLSYVHSSLTQGANAGRLTAATSMMLAMISYQPYGPLASFDTELYDPDYDDGEFKAAPDKWLSDVTNRRKDFRITPSFYADVKIAPWMNFKLTLGGDYRDSERIKFKSIRMTSTDEGSTAGIATGVDISYNIDAMFNFAKKIKGHSISGTAGATYYRYTGHVYSLQGWHIAQYKDKELSINSAPDTSTSYGESSYATLSFLARAIYNYRDRYVLTATFRADGSSKFQGANKWAYFPSAAFAWRANPEPSFHVDVISALKLRLGWGRVGNQSVSPYRTIQTYGSTFYPSHDPANPAQTIVGLYPSNLPNTSLKWETTEQWNAGLDFGMFQGRLALTVDLYDKFTRDLLQSKTIPGSSGWTSVWVNEGNIDNKGIELSTEMTPVRIKDFEFSLNGNISFNKNTIVSIGSDGETKKIFLDPNKEPVECKYFSGNTVGSGGTATYNANIFIEGKPMGLFYGLVTDGIVQEDEAGKFPSNDQAIEDGAPAGAIHYRDLDGNGIIDIEDRAIIGDPNPDFTYGFGASLTYKKLSLNLSFVGSKGNDIININNIGITNTYTNNRYSLGHNILRARYYDAWTPGNPGAKYPSLTGSNAFDSKFISDRWVEDGSYLRLASVNISYDIPLKKKEKAILRGINVGFTGGNLVVWTKYSGWDPDVNSFGTDIKRMGCDVGSYPAARTYSFDIKFTF